MYAITIIGPRRLPSRPLTSEELPDYTGLFMSGDFKPIEEDTWALCLDKIKAGCTVEVVAPTGTRYKHGDIVRLLKSRKRLPPTHSEASPAGNV